MKPIHSLICLLTALLLCLLSACAFAAEDSPIAAYIMPDGATAYYKAELSRMSVPEGYEAMYALMTEKLGGDDTYFIQMKNGVALMSVSCTAIAQDVNAEELLALWPFAQKRISAQNMNITSGDAQVEECFGETMLHVELEFTLSDGMAYIAEGFAFSREKELREIWGILPYYQEDELSEKSEESVYAYFEDVAALDALMSSLSFPESYDELIMDGAPYSDPLGMIHLLLPDDLHAVSMPTEDESIRERFILQNGDDAETLIDFIYADCDQVPTTLVYPDDMRGILAISAFPVRDTSAFLPEAFWNQAPQIREMLAETFDLVMLVSTNDRAYINGNESALMSFYIRQGELSVRLEAAVTVVGNSVYEADLYFIDSDSDTYDAFWELLEERTAYKPLYNALDEEVQP